VWNGGIFIWKVQAILAEFREHLPEILRKIETVVDAMALSGDEATLDKVWPTLQSVSIDYGILEKTKNLVVIPANLGWNDVGNWEQYGNLFPANEQGVRSVGQHHDLDSQNTIVYNTTDRAIYTIGMEDVVIVQMDNITVVCHKDQVQRVKEFAEQQKQQNKKNQ